MWDGCQAISAPLALADWNALSWANPAAARATAPEPPVHRRRDEDPIRLQNPLAPNMAVMRTTLWTGLLDILRDNLHRQHRRIRLFEMGKTFHKTAAGVTETRRVGGVVCGPAAPAQWGADSREVDFFDIKGDLEAILALTRNHPDYEFRPVARPALHPGQSAQIIHAGVPVGAIGLIHPQVGTQLDIGIPVYLFELDLDAVRVRRLPRYHKISKFPAIRRDLAVLVDDTLPLAVNGVMVTV